MTRCPSCPKLEALESFLEDLIGDENETISYKQWTHTDGNKLNNILCDSDDFIERFVFVVQKLTTYHLIARNQSAIFLLSKEKIDDESCVLVSDFFRKLLFYHSRFSARVLLGKWPSNNSSFYGLYEKTGWECLQCEHTHNQRPSNSRDTISVNAYLNPVLAHLKILNPSLKSVKYFKDGSGAQ